LPLDEDQHRQLVENSKLLMESWTIERAKQFVVLPTHRRDEFVDHLLAKVDNWGLQQLLFPSTTEQENVTSSRFMQTVNCWIERANEQERPCLRELVAHVQYRLLVQQLRRWLPRDQRASLRLEEVITAARIRERQRRNVTTGTARLLPMSVSPLP
jgi:hypothetical protein